MQKANEATPLYEFAGRRVDVARRELTRAGKAVPMFPRCFDALLLLIERRGELLEKDFLLEALWPNVIVDENSLAKVISEVRRALGEGPKDQGCIVTVPRRGYRFNANVVELQNQTASPARATAEIRSLAVLPFGFLNPAPDDDMLRIGLADALITRLGQLRKTLVRPTSSIARFSEIASPAAAGRELGVDAVIAGSVRRAGTMLRVSVQLVSVADEAVSWAERFDIESAAALELEDSIAARVATALTLALARGETPPAPRRYTANADAYEHYIRGRYLITKRTRDALLEAVARLERAIAIDPQFALAHAGLSEAWIQLGLRAAVSQSLRPREAMPKARAAAERALALDESLSEAHGTLGQVLFTYEWKREEGLREIRRAIELNPNNQNAQHWYAMQLGGLGRFDEALEQIQRALTVDPLAVMVNANVGFLLYRAGRFDEAIAKLRHTVEMEPGFVMTRYRLGLALEAKGLHEDAIREFEAMRPSADNPLALTAIARTRALMGDQDRSRRMLDEILSIARNTYVPAATIADVYVGLGDHERALEWLAVGVDERAIVSMWMHSERHWDPLRSHPKFAELIRRVGIEPP
jgi:DNA-binding winged helix-turn-helix (wHTH) protein/tetratricopeptide (TPR) repeat protein